MIKLRVLSIDIRSVHFPTVAGEPYTVECDLDCHLCNHMDSHRVGVARALVLETGDVIDVDLTNQSLIQVFIDAIDEETAREFRPVLYVPDGETMLGEVTESTSVPAFTHSNVNCITQSEFCAILMNKVIDNAKSQEYNNRK